MEDKSKFGPVLIFCTTSVFLLYCGFGEVCYFVFGEKLTTPLITSNLPKGNPVTWILKILLCINVLFTYPLILYPASILCEEYIFKSMKKSSCRTWLKNLFRALLVAFTVVVAVALGTNVGNFLSLLGGFSCVVMAYTLPAIFHYKLMAKTTCSKFIDILIIIVSLFIVVFVTTLVLLNW